jgi:hypothetical protein
VPFIADRRRKRRDGLLLGRGSICINRSRTTVFKKFEDLREARASMFLEALLVT